VARVKRGRRWPTTIARRDVFFSYVQRGENRCGGGGATKKRYYSPHMTRVRRACAVAYFYRYDFIIVRRGGESPETARPTARGQCKLYVYVPGVAIQSGAVIVV